MSTTLPPAQPPVLAYGHETPHKLFRARGQQWADQPALRHKKKGIWSSTSWSDYYAHARATGLALADLGLQRGDAIAILSENRPEWLYADMGAQCMGFLCAGIYPTSSPEQVQYIVNDAGAQVLFVENQEQYDKVTAIRQDCPSLRRVVITDNKGLRELDDAMVQGFDAFLAHGQTLARTRAADFDAAIDAGQPDGVAFLVYTSGTTGAPKGAMISNRNLAFQIANVHEYLQLAPQDRALSFLPLCHIAERMGTVFNPLALGQIVHFPENASTIFNDVREVAPQVLFGPPRFWQKLHTQVTLYMQDALPMARRAYASVTAEGATLAQARLDGQPVTGWRAARYRLMQKVVLSNLRSFLGLQNLKSAMTGAAPVPPDLLRWYMAIGIDLLEAFGLTETCGFCTSMPPQQIRIGSAGVACKGTEIRIGPENEILVRGPNVFAGYWKLPAQTREVIGEDGWLHTGDCGEIDADGYLHIKDRIKDIIITSGGKNITPSNIESHIKFSPYVSDAVVIGEGRHYLTCLIMIDQETVARFAQDRQLSYTDFASMTRTQDVVDLINAEIERVNSRLARVEQIKSFRIISQQLDAEDEELTPTMKLKRKVVARKYAALIDSMYAG
ncbi:MAG: AMP-binding protein [Rhodoferax sp.]|nr:AMP-binding protein [Rhodoferax sp.]MBP9931448.1 AMP-binding protein [Rhodoferax sp.]HQX60510.1 AMP-binding protein [Burkholderiaceae bacterium]HQZ08050.1 AMP-binding protein [Burkholderiaceae bacterium]